MATVDTLIEDARSYASEAFTSSEALVNSAVSTISGLDTGFTLTGPDFAAVNPVTIDQTLPTFAAPDFDLPDAPEAPSDFQLPDLVLPDAPENDTTKPTFIDPTLPATLRQLDVTAPTITTTFEFPTVPDALVNVNIVAPTLTDHDVPVAPTLSLPVFSATKPDDDISAPTDYVDQFASAYNSAAPSMYAALDGQMDTFLGRFNPRFKEQLAALEDKIAKYVAGGTALSADVENGIYERTRDKVNAESRRTMDNAFTDAGKRGFTLPSGMLMSAVQQARQAGADNNARAAIDIAVKQAELEQSNVQFALTLSSQLRTTALSAMISYHQSLIQINGQALSYAQSVLNAAVQIYDTLIKAFSAKLDAYRAEASVYETQLNGVRIQVEIYQAQISALEALVNVDQSKVNIYRARIDALNALGNVYQTQVNVVLGKASIEKMKLELYGEQVQAYATEASAKASEYQGYSAAINGQSARQQAYGEEVRAYATEIDAYRATIQAKTAAVQLKLSYNESLLKQYSTETEAYRAIVGAKAQIASTKLENDRVLLYAFQAKVSAAQAQSQTTLGYYQTKANIANEGTKVVLQAAVEQGRLTTEQIKAIASTSISGAQVYEGLASAALGGMNTLVSSSS